MPQTTILWLALLVALLVVFVVTVRRMSKLIARTRDLEGFQRSVASLDARLAAVVDPLVAQLDEIRRRSGDPQALAARFDSTQAALRDLAAEGRALRAPAALLDRASALVAELERAARAADLVEHGLDALVSHRGGRELEAQTSLKRGALNLRHARSAATRLAAEIASIRPADLVHGSDGHTVTVTVHPPSTFRVEGDADDEGMPYPRM